MAPPQTPPDIAAKLSEAVIDALKAPDLAAKLREQSMIVAANPPAETEAFIKKEIERWRSVIVRRASSRTDVHSSLAPLARMIGVHRACWSLMKRSACSGPWSSIGLVTELREPRPEGFVAQDQLRRLADALINFRPWRASTHP
jgi:Tripartite tricarboxylate transporter family receptor